MHLLMYEQKRNQVYWFHFLKLIKEKWLKKKNLRYTPEYTKIFDNKL